LKNRGALVTFFLSNGRGSKGSGSLWLSSLRSDFKEATGLGCEFGNHTWSHKNLYEGLYSGKLNFSSLKRDLRRVEERGKELGIVLKPYFRPPYGHMDERLNEAVYALGYEKVFLWTQGKTGSLDLKDYVTRKTIRTYSKRKETFLEIRNRAYRNVDETLEFLLKEEAAHPRGLNGAILLMHAGTARKTEKLVDGLSRFLETFQSMGYEFVTLSRLMEQET